ncbi:alpha/beta fold hydrolase [Spongisporangium articulatum]|uniref:Alpha/beta fold hydrolase n=1 Tax=Spongisporangium articulatum TaxID=3362603 RepID=A0ABW8AJP2_9ACTN
MCEAGRVKLGAGLGAAVRRPRLLVALVVLLIVLGFLLTRGGAPAGTFSVESVRVAGVREVDKQPVTLEGTIYLPTGGGKHPAVLLAHGYGGSMDSVAPQARYLAERGYVVLAYSARGFGFSDGKVHLDSPDYEVKDGQRMLDVLAQRPEVQLDAPGDPHVAVVGASYGGALALLLGGTDRRVDALVPSITWNDLRQALFPQFATTGRPTTAAQVTPVAGAGPFKKQWAAIFFGSTLGSGAGGGSGRAGAGPQASPTPTTRTPGLSRDEQARQQLSLQALSNACGNLSGDLCLAYLQTAESGRPTADLLKLLAASSPARVTARITAPTLLIQGEADSLFPLSEADANAREIAANGTPVSLVWTGDGHDGGTSETDREWQLTADFLDRVLHGKPPAGDRFRVTVPDGVVSSVDSNPAPQHRSTAVVPGLPAQPGQPAQSLRTASLPLSGREQLAISPPGATPSALTSLPGLGALTGLLGSSAGASATGGTSLSALPGQTATFDTAPLTRALTVTGSGRVTVKITSTATDVELFASLVDVAPNGSTTLPEQLVAPVRLSNVPGAGREVTIALPGVVHDVPVGHRLRVVLSATDQAYAVPLDTRAYRISLAGTGGLTLPTVPLAVEADGSSSRGPWIAALLLAAALAAVLVGGLALRRRAALRDRRTGDDGLAEVPIAIEGLGKAYGDGFRAVSDLTFRVEAGQVLGLLGPNGAGKTTTLRMLMGLITPTEGDIRVFGHLVRPGAPVLSRVGSFVEGPGFLPHLSGLRNLELFWRATGRPADDARFGAALEVAGLGDDVHRKVRTYSQGMRQRLAIAQAMLGLPELLVLDEPTNGLDPPQIREMREVLQRYAATGRTVLVSSHLLAEVEQTCSHVVVMARGRLVAQGPVAEMVGEAHVVVVDVDEPFDAGEVAGTVEGVGDVRVTDTGLVVSAAAPARAALVEALVGAGHHVSRVAPQRGLEETFLTLVGGEDA